MTANAFLGPESYTVKSRGSGGSVKLKVPSTSYEVEYPTGFFKVEPKDEFKDDPAAGKASVLIQPQYAFRDREYVLGSALLVAVTGATEDDQGLVSDWREFVPALSLEVEDGVPTDERTLKIVRTVAAHAIAAHNALKEVE